MPLLVLNWVVIEILNYLGSKAVRCKNSISSLSKTSRNVFHRIKTR